MVHLPDEQTAADLERWVADKTGLKHDAFCACVLLTQGEATKFITSPAGARQQVLMQLLDLRQYERLAARGVRVIEGVVTAVESVDGVVSGIRVDDRRSFPVEVGVVGTTMTARSELLEDLGVEPEAMEMRGHVIAHKVPVDAMGATSVPGVYAAGNVTDPSAQIIVAAAAGNAAGGGINSDLVEEDTVAAVVARRG